MKVLQNFLDDKGCLKAYPSKHRLKIAALFYLASKFEPSKRYSEAEVNDLLRNWHTFEDWAMLRRELYNKRFINRAPDGSTYWMEETQPTLASFGWEE